MVSQAAVTAFQVELIPSATHDTLCWTKQLPHLDEMLPLRHIAR